jgi:hypothetical protein
MPRFTNGGIVGKEAVRPTLSSASSGIWSLGSQHIYKVSNVWPAQPIIADGLQVHLDAGNLASYSGSGSTWFDISGNSRHATLENSPTWSSSNQGFFTFNGTNQRGINSSSSGVLNNGSRSISSWFKGTVGDQIPLSLGTSGGNNNAFAGVPQTSLTGLNVYGLLSTFDESITITSTNLLDNNWKNLVLWDPHNIYTNWQIRTITFYTYLFRPDRISDTILSPSVPN